MLKHLKLSPLLCDYQIPVWIKRKNMLYVDAKSFDYPIYIYIYIYIHVDVFMWYYVVSQLYM